MGFIPSQKKKKCHKLNFFSSLYFPLVPCVGGEVKRHFYIDGFQLTQSFFSGDFFTSFPSNAPLRHTVHFIEMYILLYQYIQGQQCFFFTINPRFCLRYSVGKTACQSERCNLSNFRAIDAHLKTAPTKFVHIQATQKKSLFFQYFIH